LIDDDLKNIKDFVALQKKIENNDAIMTKVRQIHNIPAGETFPPIQFFGLLVKPDGSLKRLTK